MSEADLFLIRLLAAAVVGGLTAYVAKRKERNAVGWGFAGFFFGVFPLIVLAFLKTKKLPEYTQL